MESQSVDQQKLVHGDEIIVKQGDEIQLAALKIIGGKRQSKIFVVNFCVATLLMLAALVVKYKFSNNGAAFAISLVAFLDYLFSGIYIIYQVIRNFANIVMYYASSVAPPAQPPHHLSCSKSLLSKKLVD